MGTKTLCDFLLRKVTIYHFVAYKIFGLYFDKEYVTIVLNLFSYHGALKQSLMLITLTTKFLTRLYNL